MFIFMVASLLMLALAFESARRVASPLEEGQDEFCETEDEDHLTARVIVAFELACRAARAEKCDLVLAVFIEINEVSLPAACVTEGEVGALAADEFSVHINGIVVMSH
jgi:hypothetical protein